MAINNTNNPNSRPSGANILSEWIDILTKVVTVLLSVGGFLLGIYQFNSQQEQNAKAEFDRQMFSRSLESYSKMTQIVSKITTLKLPSDSAKYDSLQTVFDENYWGSLLLIQQNNVRQALRELKSEIVDVRSGQGNVEYIRLRQDYLSEQFRIALKRYRDPKYDKIDSE